MARNAAGTEAGWAAMFDAAFVRSQTAMALTDDQRRLIRVNGALSQLTGYRPADLVGRHTYDFVIGGPLMDRETWTEAIARGVATGEVEVRRADGDSMRVQFGVHPDELTGLVLFVALSVSRWGRHFRRADSEALGNLSKREREVVSMVAAGATSHEIGAALHISHNTVRKHVNSAMRKLGARSRAHLVAKAMASGSLAA